MSGTKLHIQMIEQDSFDTWAIRFTGPEPLFMGLISCFQREGCVHARWDPDALHGLLGHYWESIQKRLAVRSIPSWLTPGDDDWKELVARVGVKEATARRQAALRDLGKGQAS